MNLSFVEVDRMASELAARVTHIYPNGPRDFAFRAYGVPRGGVYAALALKAFLPIVLVEHPQAADFFVDDLIDSGETMERLCDAHPGTPFFALLDKREQKMTEWVTFPWEQNDGRTETIEENVVRILQFIGEKADRSGLIETPRRVAKAWQNYWAAGYKANIASLFKAFEDGAEGVGEMVVVKNIPFYSHCEHHMAPFFGTVTIGYLPDERILGLSKFSRVVKAFAQRLQVQERLTTQIADAIMEHLKPHGVGVFISARHMCMESRGVEQQGSFTETTALRGMFINDSDVKGEFLSRI